LNVATARLGVGRGGDHGVVDPIEQVNADARLVGHAQDE